MEVNVICSPAIYGAIPPYVHLPWTLLLLIIFGEIKSVFVNGRPVCPVSEAEVLFKVI